MKRTARRRPPRATARAPSPSRISRERPRVALRAAADHHRGRAGRREHRLRPRARRDVAARRHGNVDELDELGGQRVVGRAGVHLPRRARVERQASPRRPRRAAGRPRGTCASRSRARAASSR